MLAAYLITQGEPANDAIRRVRSVEPAAIETPQQILVLRELAIR
jgi:protein-tyrosine phosphatase